MRLRVTDSQICQIRSEAIICCSKAVKACAESHPVRGCQLPARLHKYRILKFSAGAATARSRTPEDSDHTSAVANILPLLTMPRVHRNIGWCRSDVLQLEPAQPIVFPGRRISRLLDVNKAVPWPEDRLLICKASYTCLHTGMKDNEHSTYLLP